jgi:acetyltransferase EpsM
MALIIVAGASGQHAAVVHEAAVLSGLEVLGFATLGDEAPPFNTPCLGRLEAIAAAGIAQGYRFHIACGANALRRTWSEALLAQGALLQSVVHPAAMVSPSARGGWLRPVGGRHSGHTGGAGARRDPQSRLQRRP